MSSLTKTCEWSGDLACTLNRMPMRECMVWLALAIYNSVPAPRIQGESVIWLLISRHGNLSLSSCSSSEAQQERLSAAASVMNYCTPTWTIQQGKKKDELVAMETETWSDADWMQGLSLSLTLFLSCSCFPFLALFLSQYSKEFYFSISVLQILLNDRVIYALCALWSKGT